MFPILKYCSAHGDTPVEALREVMVAIEACLATAKKHGKRVALGVGIIMSLEQTSMIDPDFMLLVTLVAFAVAAVVHLGFAVGVWHDRTDRLVLVNKRFWVVATLVGGVMVAGVYWVLHHWDFDRHPGVEDVR